MESADYLDFGNPDAGQGKPRNNECNEYLFSLISRIIKFWFYKWQMIFPTIWTSLFADDKFLPISAVKVAGGAIIFDFEPEK